MNGPAALPGPRLKAERERRGLSAQKAADEMHLDRWVIEALEGDDYARIGPTVYAKGHLKKYASLLGLPPAEVLAGFDSGAQPRIEPPSAGPSMLLRPREDASSRASALAPIAVCVVVLAGGILWWRPWHVHGKAAINGAPAAAVAAAATPRVKAEPGLVASASASPAVARDTPATPAAAAPQGAVPAPEGAAANTANAAKGANAAEALAQPLPGGGRARLRLSFSADSWVEIHDAAGRRTFAGNGRANSVKTISGTAPLQVYLGSGSGVQLEINDRAVAIGPQFFAGDVARFEAGADGVLRRDSRPDQSHGALPRNPRPPG
ncbi:MAG TPA: RodZ domain-containing protein [Steroidobacteraceae bacterium]|jgi:cytoskeleton protein RodZ|nr:RodZ domain-containing protein [Steroidobacteraceae bacterium]